MDSRINVTLSDQFKPLVARHGLPKNALVGELEKMRAMAAGETLGKHVRAAPDLSFAELMKRQVEDVNALQMDAGKLTQLFEIGDEHVSLADVMIATQKSRVAFSAVVEVRNRLLSAYQEIMSMSV